MRKLNRRLVSLAYAGTTGVLLAGLVGGFSPAMAGPPSSGTVKIDGLEFDNHPNNEPHVGCEFEVDFYGFGTGDLYADVTFEAQSPTPKDGDDQVVATGRTFIGEDDNSGGASEAGWDASASFVLDLTGMTPHAVQGYHLKLTVAADGAKGAKHKVLWVEACVPPPDDEPPTDE